MIWLVEYVIDGKRRTKKFETESETDKFCEKLNKLISEEKCGGYFVTVKGR